MTKQKFIEWLNKLPNDIQIFSTEQDEYDCVNVKVFVKSKDDTFIEKYFAP